MDFAQDYANYEGFWGKQDTDSKNEAPNPSRKPIKKSKVAVDYLAELSIIFDDLVHAFNFQKDNGRNMQDYFIVMWESRNARTCTNGEQKLSSESLISIYEEYIWGTHSNFTKWYRFVYGFDAIPAWFTSSGPEFLITRAIMTQIALWLLIWGESNNLRVMPELLCFIFDMMMTEYKFYSRAKEEVLLKTTDDESISPPSFLRHVVNPLYEFCQFQITWNKSNDHSHIIGYDDINQCFWSLKSINQFKLKDGTNYADLQLDMKYSKFTQIEWSKSLRKTYIESRTWYHLITNFHRIWTIHVATFWYFSVINLKPLFTKHYIQTLDNDPELFVLFSVMSLAGTFSCLITIAAIIGEMFFVPRGSNLRKPTKPRLFILIFMLLLNIIPPSGILSLFHISRKRLINENILTIISFISLTVSIVTTIFLSIVPLSRIDTIFCYITRPYSPKIRSINSPDFGTGSRISGRNSTDWNLNNNVGSCDNINPFTENWSQFDSSDANLCSVGLWFVIWTSKLVETYFFLCTSIKNPARDLFQSNLNCSGTDTILQSALCRHWTKFLLLLLVATNFVLYLLDTYLWYVIYNSIFSLTRSIYMGMSHLTPWKNCFVSLTNKIKLKILPSNQEWNIGIISELWNEIIYSMYRENLICKEHVERLIFHLTNDDNLLKPSLLSSTDDHFFRSRVFKKSKEVRRRLTFFAQSLHCPLPDAGSIEDMPTFSVLIPHYKEKIMLSLKDIIKAETENSSITLLEYLKLIYPTEWDSFIEETNKLMDSVEAGVSDESNTSSTDREEEEKETDVSDNEEVARNITMNLCKNKNEGVNLFKFTGFKLEVPEQTIRTRIWASLRTQTLYRTISGFMKYLDAIKSLHTLECTKDTKHSVLNRNVKHRTQDQHYGFQQLRSNSKKNPDYKSCAKSFKQNTDSADDKSTSIALKKFHMICSMQRMSEFTDDEKADRNVLLTAFPSLKIAYIVSELDKASGRKIYYSCVIDGYCDIDGDGEYIPKYKIELSGDPILGNGKSDNQNHSIIFTRGEYIQLIDANQDNYFEECLKIKNILKEFDDTSANSDIENVKDIAPVAIVGTREHIFSENNGVLGDIAAGKEKVFGTFFARTLGYINSKLHYGHPDFINAIFITTRGGVSKAQRGLHLNEDIYVGMNVLMRGGRIKHAEYYQCGKGRDLSFNSILNFTTKIGSGMGEQLLSREHFYIGTSLPLDRFLSFYYAHPGFHLNNVFIYISLCLFLIIILNLAVLIDSSVLCVYDPAFKQTDPWEPDGCLQLVPVLYWLRRSTITLLFISMFSFVPLFLQQMNDKGVLSATKRLLKQLASGAIFFELFSNRIASQALMTDILIGDAKYLSTTRGLSFERIPFVTLFTRFASETAYFAGMALVILGYASTVMWDVSLLYFWIYFTSLLLSPFIFNPSQYHWIEFITDYRRTLSWLLKWQRRVSWLKYARGQNSMIQWGVGDNTNWFNIASINVWCHILPQGLLTVFTVIPFVLANINNAEDSKVNVLLRLLIVVSSTVTVNALTLMAIFILSSIYGIVVLQGKQQWFPRFLTRLTIFISLLSMIVAFILLSFFQRWDVKTIILGLLSSLMIQKLFYQIVCGVIMPANWNNDRRNESWWTGKWFRRNHSFFSPLIEFIQKVLELSIFNLDFVLVHIILLLQVPILMIPNVDTLHSLMLFWRKADIDARPIIFKKKGKSKFNVNIYALAFMIILAIMTVVFSLPLILNQLVVIDSDNLRETTRMLIQPEMSIALRSEIGLKAYHNMMRAMFNKPRVSNT
ncbi:hypothetical protein KDRO_C04770 [Kluyveromyces lactis]|nr:hypothetical protein KDRO_C04770 [Kluyveromyces lactis]